MNLAEAVALALQQNRIVENAYLNRILDKFDLQLADDEFAPQYNIGSSVQYDSYYQDPDGRDARHSYGANASVTLNVPTGGQFALTAAHNASIDDSDDYQDSVTLGFSQPLLKGGGVTVGTASWVFAQRAELSNLLNLESTLSDVIVNIIKQYRSYVSAVRGLEITRLSLQRSQEQLEITRELINSGRLPQVELVQSETDVANQELDLRSTENDLDAARITLLRLLRLPPETQLELSESLQVAAYDRELEELKRLAFNHRNDYAQAQISVENAELELALAQNNQLWQLDAEVSYGLSRSGDNNPVPLEKLDSPQQGDVTVGLQLSIPLSDLSQRRQLVAAKISLQQARNALQELEEDIVFELLNAHRDLQIRWEQLALTKRSLELSRKQLELEQEKLKVGRSSSFQVVSFQNSLVEAENSYLDAQIAYLNALTDLDQLLGTTLQHWGVTVESVERQQTGLGAYQ